MKINVKGRRFYAFLCLTNKKSIMKKSILRIFLYLLDKLIPGNNRYARIEETFQFSDHTVIGESVVCILQRASYIS